MFDTTEKRELYKAMRSAHDGICPLCGGIVKELDGGYFWLNENHTLKEILEKFQKGK